jgi:hypothetical protein
VLAPPIGETAPRWLRDILKPTVEMLAAIPSLVVGFFGVVVVAAYLNRHGAGYNGHRPRSPAPCRCWTSWQSHDHHDQRGRALAAVRRAVREASYGPPVLSVQSGRQLPGPHSVRRGLRPAAARLPGQTERHLAARPFAPHPQVVTARVV